MQRDSGDILDRGAIAKLKYERIRNSECCKEWDAFKIELIKISKKYPSIPIEWLFKLLYDINAMIWDLESDLRQGKLDGVLSEVGRRAIEIREHNNLRVQVKNIINKLTNEGYIDVKKDHISETK